MTPRATILVPAEADTALLSGLIESLMPQLTDEDELILVDDSGEGVIAAWAEEHCSSAKVITRELAGGMAAAIQDGLAAATGIVVVLLQPRARLRPGCLEQLIEALEDLKVNVAAAEVVDGEGSGGAPAMCFDDGRLHTVQRESSGLEEPFPVPFAPIEAFAVRRSQFTARGGLDPLFLASGWAGVDLGLATWRSGAKVVQVPAAQIELAQHYPQPGLPAELARAGLERDRLLTFWKYVDTRPLAHDHLTALWRDALDAGIAGRREELIWMALALQELRGANASRRALGQPRRALEQMLRESDPLGA
ncbi:MAG: glycosyltransferase [Planctomycetota bacterium]|nr:glycosyltransferase [Planctomycetota bacterium]